MFVKLIPLCDRAKEEDVVFFDCFAFFCFFGRPAKKEERESLTFRMAFMAFLAPTRKKSVEH